MLTEQGLYAQVVMLYWKDLNITEKNKNKNEYKFKFQGQSARSQRWFDLDIDYIEENLSHMNLIYIERSIKGTIKQKIQIHLKCLKFQLEIKNVWRKWSLTVRPQCLNIVKIHWIFIVSVVWRQPLTVPIKPGTPII